MSLFRPEALDAKRRRLWGEVRLAQPPAFIAWTVVLSLVSASLFGALVFGRYTRKETVEGFLIPEAGVVQVRPVQAGRIGRVLVRDGQLVQAGAALVEFISDLESTGQAPVLDIQMAETDAQVSALANRQAALVRSNADERSRLNDQIAANTRTRAILQERRRVQAEALVLSEADAQRMTQLQARGYATNAQIDAKRRSVLTERGALADLDTQISELDTLVTNLKGQIASLPAREAEGLAILASERSSLTQRRAELQVARGHVLRSPINGRVSALQARPGMSPDTTQAILSLSPEGSPLEARLLVPTRAVGFLRVGQEARLQVEAFPFQRFGFVEGRVIDIAKTVTRPGDAAFPIAQDQPVYEVRVALERDHVMAYGERRALQSGMSLRADLPIDRRRLWQQLFDPLLAAGKRAS
ncbi:HlyD family secretion protein [Brevundimonas sp. NPDC090276]|uniref:HlyD family secretion protein n=1 Tax=Brevundimonas sp. NPDC090276 TaxID=3363956 RepID=UPI00383B7631